MMRVATAIVPIVQHRNETNLTHFSDLGLAAPLLKAVAAEGYDIPTPIQAKAIPVVLQGRDILGIAQTGTGKTAAFALPILNRLAAQPLPLHPKSPRVLVLAPTRELASQIAESFGVYGRFLKVRTMTAFGGVGIGGQIRSLAQGVDVLVATPGRLIDLMQQRAISFARIEVLVLDEADRMLDMGFIHHIRQIVKQLPAARQTLFFSATMPKDVASLAEGMLKSPERVAVTPVASTAERIDQRVVFVETAAKNKALQALLGDEKIVRAIVFTRTKHGADRVARHLDKAGIANGVIHGNKSQNNRERALAAFRSGDSRLLIATDIAARGIDVDGVTHVINFDLPNVPETYVHRIGRTARAGAEGLAISFCSRDERAYLKDIEKLTKQQIASMPLAFDATPEPRAAEPRVFDHRDADPRGHRSENHRPGKPRHGGGGHQGEAKRGGEARRGDQRKGAPGKPQPRAGSPAPGSPAALAQAVTRRERETTGPVRFGQGAGA